MPQATEDQEGAAGGPAQVITSMSDPVVRRILDLNKSARVPVRTVIIEDEEPLAQCLAAGMAFEEVYAVAGMDIDAQVEQLAAAAGVPLRWMSAEVVNAIFKGDRKAKMFGIAKVPRAAQLADLDGLTGDIVVLDGVRITGNIGAIVRSATALGASAVVVVDSDLSTVADRRLVRASRGFVFSMPVVLAETADVVAYLRESGTAMVALDAGGDTTMPEFRSQDRRFAWVFGSEKFGPSREFLEAAQSVVALPICTVESLNVSVSVGIVLYERTGYNLVPTNPAPQ